MTRCTPPPKNLNNHFLKGSFPPNPTTLNTFNTRLSLLEGLELPTGNFWVLFLPSAPHGLEQVIVAG